MWRLSHLAGFASFQVDALGIVDLLEFHRRRNARVICTTLLCLDAGVALLLELTLSLPLAVLLTLLGMALGSGAGLLFTRYGRIQLGMFTLLLVQLAGHVAVVSELAEISVVPMFACLAVLVAAATLGSRYIIGVFSMAAATIGVETWIAMAEGFRWAALAAPVTGGIVLLVSAAVISFLHVRETERAVAIAEERDRLRRKAVDDARASEERYRLIADNTDDLIALIADKGIVGYSSPSHRRKLGTDQADAFQRYMHPDDVAVARSAWFRACETGHATAVVRLQPKDGQTLTFECQLSLVTLEPEPLVAVISRDVTERNALEAELQKAQRMESLGRLASGVAHDFNNLLGVIAGAIDLVADSIRPEDPAGQDVTIVRQTVARATELTRQLLTFSRKEVVAREPLASSVVLKDMTELIRRVLGSAVQLHMEIMPALPSIHMSQSQLEQIVVNLAANARDAMPGGGQLTIVGRPCALGASEIVGLSAGVYLELLFTDTGVGIESADLPHIFEPFFTTKPASRGTGLGLSTCYGIASQCGGTIVVTTERGVGTTFRLLLPESSARESQHAQSPAGPRVAKGRERILVVDDDTSIISLAARMLTTAGYEVTSAETFATAQQILQNQEQPFDILLTDIVLGCDRGTLLAKQALQEWPDIRVVLMSGYAPDPDDTIAMLGKRAGYLPKPFDRGSLLAALDARRPSIATGLRSGD
jgi:PAS domain S-box-containing protein